MSALLVLVGLAFGPSGLGVLTPVLTFLDPIVPVAFAVLGVLVAVYASPARKLVMIAIVAGGHFVPSGSSGEFVPSGTGVNWGVTATVLREWLQRPQ